MGKKKKHPTRAVLEGADSVCVWGNEEENLGAGQSGKIRGLTSSRGNKFPGILSGLL